MNNYIQVKNYLSTPAVLGCVTMKPLPDEAKEYFFARWMPFAKAKGWDIKVEVEHNRVFITSLDLPTDFLNKLAEFHDQAESSYRGDAQNQMSKEKEDAEAFSLKLLALATRQGVAYDDSPEEDRTKALIGRDRNK